MKKNKGFTLIELLAVIVILGILLSIGTLAVNNIRKKQEIKNKVNVISSILTGAKEYISDNKNELVFDASGVKKISINNLRGKYAEIDDRYADLIWGNNGTDRSTYRYVTIGQCVNATGEKTGKLEYRYYMNQTASGWEYEFTDCGCEQQDSNTISYKLCDGHDSGAGWDINGRYYNRDKTQDSSKNIRE